MNLDMFHISTPSLTTHFAARNRQMFRADASIHVDLNDSQFLSVGLCSTGYDGDACNHGERK
ncbi:hypothetical protein SK128_025942 [Halocaridina rubra]|uniref:Uncharacterized protein n=1 Tax=Halocaridina rubra TaxID=373956 RepID=A0AAN8WS34_HALRR